METTADEGQGGGPRLHHHRLQQASPPSGVGASSGSSSSSTAPASGSSSLLRPHKRKLSRSHEDFVAAATASSNITSTATVTEVEVSGTEAYRRSPAHGEAKMAEAQVESETSIDSSPSARYAGGAPSSDDDGAVVLDDLDPRSSEGLCIRRLQGCTPSSASVARVEAARSDAPRSPTALQFPPTDATSLASCASTLSATVAGSSSTGFRTRADFPSYFYGATHASAAAALSPSHPASVSRPPSPTATLLEAHHEGNHTHSPASSNIVSFAREEGQPQATSVAASASQSRTTTVSTTRLRLVVPFKSNAAKRRMSSAKASMRRHSAARRPDETSSSCQSGAVVRLAELHKLSSSSMRRCSLGDAASQSRPANCSGLAEPSTTTEAASVPANDFMLQPVPINKRRKTALVAAQALASTNAGPAANIAAAEGASQSLQRVEMLGSEAAPHASPVEEQLVEMTDNPLAAQPASQRYLASGLFSTSVDSMPTDTVAGSRFLLPLAPVTGECRTPLARAPAQPTNVKHDLLHGNGRGRETEQVASTSSASCKRNLPHLIAQGFHKKRYPRLRRTQSLPNLKARPLADLAAPVIHRLILPTHLAQYLASITRAQERSAAEASGSSRGASSARGVFTPSLHPPITRHTLRELDLSEILKNPQLRHDVVFDPNVQFRPNFDGERGRRKREAGDKYWAAVVREIERGCTCTSFDGRTALPCTCTPNHLVASTDGSTARKLPVPPPPSRAAAGGRIPSRMPLLIQELRTICLSILPMSASGETLGTPGNPAQAPPSATARAAAEKQSEASAKAIANNGLGATGTSSISAHLSSPSWMSSHHTLILQTLDPHLITQELAHGVLDVCALITFLGSVLKLHCAPMRDEVIERMVATVVEDHDVGRGLRMCFEILELMKLDIANHQLRTARPYLVDTAVDFETRWFREQLDQGKVSLERTASWFTSALSAVSGPSSQLTRTEQISRAFNDGLLRLIFEAPTPLSLASPSAPNSSATALGAGVALSSSSLNHAYVTFFPETFQFDAYRLITIHADATDITVLHMLLLLFRQLACSPLLAGDAPSKSLSLAQVASNAATLAGRQLDSVKQEIWCLLCDANLSVCNAPAPSRPGEMPRTPSTPSSRAAAIAIGGVTGSAKVEDPRWRAAMGDVLLQIAARAGAVQVAARNSTCLSAATSASMSQVAGTPPSERVLAMLSSWLDNNMRTSSALHKLCQNRLRTVVSAMLVDRLGSSPTRIARKSPRLQAVSFSPLPRKRSDSDDPASETSCKRLRLENSSISRGSTGAPSVFLESPQAQSCESAFVPTDAATANTDDWEALLVQSGLQPLGAEVRLLGERVAKVASFHLHVMRSLYEKIAASAAPYC